MMNASRSQSKGAERISTIRLFRATGAEAYIEIVHKEGEKKKAETSITRAIKRCFEKIQIFSRFDSESELSKFNRHLGSFEVASPDMHTVALRALSYHKESDGLFDPRILPVLEDIGYRTDFSLGKMPPSPQRKLLPIQRPSLKRDLKIWGEMLRFDVPMDFSGIAKGYIIDRMADSLAEDGWNDFLVDAGGDMFVRGTNREGTLWRIDIENIPEGKLLLEFSEEGMNSNLRRHAATVEVFQRRTISPSCPSETSLHLFFRSPFGYSYLAKCRARRLSCKNTLLYGHQRWSRHCRKVFHPRRFCRRRNLPSLPHELRRKKVSR